MKNNNTFILLIIFIIGFCFRLTGINWDQGQHLHPDERFLTMVLTDIDIPQNFIQYLNPQTSTLNPYNQGYSFFVYGSFPLNLVKVLGELFGLKSYDQIYIVGRFLTILLDTFIILLIYLISTKIFNPKIGLISAFFYSIYVLPIQLAHFYTVDPFLNFFIILTFYLLILLKNKSKIFLKIILLSLVFGIAIACKISAIYFLPIIFIFFIYYFFQKPFIFLLSVIIFVFFTSFSLRLNQPQIFSSGNILNWNLNPQFVENILELKSYDNNPFYPPAIQWLKTIPLLFPLKNIFFWGLGLPLGLVFISSIIFSVYFLVKKQFSKKFYLSVILFWIVFLIIFQGLQPVTTMRYFLPIYPFIAIISGFFVSKILKNTKLSSKRLFLIVLILLVFIYPLSFISIYFKDHSRVSASKWIYQNIPVGSTIATEYWDDALPLSIGNSLSSFFQYKELLVADKEDELKMENIISQVKQSDYLVLSSNRFYLPIPKNSDIFPNTSKYYQTLFDGSLGFTKVAEFTSYPCFPPIGKPLYCLNDTILAEEAFTVYDHPKVYIFKNNFSY